MEPRQEIIVTDIRMPFASMVIFMIKWAVAAIPAFIILSLLFMMFSMLFGGMLGGMHHMGRGF